MNFLIPCEETDDLDFIIEVNNLLTERILEFKPLDLTVTYVKNCFDSKWLKFSGTAMHEIAIWKSADITIPPFNPNRILNSLNFYLVDKQYKRTSKVTPLHINQASSDNLKRRINDVSADGIFIWYSSNSKINERGSVLIYSVKYGDCVVFYANLSKCANGKWKSTLLSEK